MGVWPNFLYENIWVDTTESILDAQVWQKEPKSAPVCLRQDESPVCSACIVTYKSSKVQINSTILKALRCSALNSIVSFAWPNVETKASLHRQRWKASTSLLSPSPFPLPSPSSSEAEKTVSHLWGSIYTHFHAYHSTAEKRQWGRN